jgi:hypothetical protein
VAKLGFHWIKNKIGNMNRSARSQHHLVGFGTTDDPMRAAANFAGVVSGFACVGHFGGDPGNGNSADYQL